MSRLTKIVATLGPATEDTKVLKKLIEAGVNVVRINCSHGDWKVRKKRIADTRKISAELKKAVAVLLDLQGPKIRTSACIPEEGIEVKDGEVVILSPHDKRMDLKSNPKIIPVCYETIAINAKVGRRVLIDDGKIRLVSESIEGEEVKAKVIFGGVIKAKKGVNVPDSSQRQVEAITEKDREDLKEAIEVGVDFIALSFVRSADNIIELRKLIESESPASPTKVIAKIEKPQALNELDRILEVSDGVMVARGDLGVELDPEKVPLAQKEIISKANQFNKIVITATQMMDSMINNPFPTRAEVSDVANAILDGTDAIMLSGETAMGKYPIETVEYMNKVALEIEAGAPIKREEIQISDEEEEQNKLAMANSICSFTVMLDYVKAIAAFSCSGSSAQLISKLRPQARIIAATTYQHTYNYLAMVWGVTPVYFDKVEHTTTTIANLEEQLIEEGIIEKDDTIVLTGGLPIVARSSANFIKLHKCDGWMRTMSNLKSYKVYKDLGPMIKA